MRKNWANMILRLLLKSLNHFRMSWARIRRRQPYMNFQAFWRCSAIASSLEDTLSGLSSPWGSSRLEKGFFQCVRIHLSKKLEQNRASVQGCQLSKIKCLEIAHLAMMNCQLGFRVANSLLSQELNLCFSDTKFTKAPYTKKYTRFFLDTKWDTEQYQILSHTKIFWWY